MAGGSSNPGLSFKVKNTFTNGKTANTGLDSSVGQACNCMEAMTSVALVLALVAHQKFPIDL
jgi:hypothetical protein